MKSLHTKRVNALARRAFSLVELLVALAISVALLTATLVALDASYTAYQRTTREASTHTISRLTMERIMTLIRTGEQFGPLPTNPNDSIVTSNFIEVITTDDEGDEYGLVVDWVPAEEALYIRIFNPETGDITASYVLLEGVIATVDPDSGDVIPPFTLQYELGYTLHRATINLSVIPDDNLSVHIEGTESNVIRMVATAMPRRTAYKPH